MSQTTIFDQAQRDRTAYVLAQEYLLSFAIVTREMIDRHLFVSESQRPYALADVYRQLLDTAHNAGMMPGVIGATIGKIESLEVVLCDFQPAAIVEKYGRDWEAVLNAIVSEVNPRGKIRARAEPGC